MLLLNNFSGDQNRISLIIGGIEFSPQNDSQTHKKHLLFSGKHRHNAQITLHLKVYLQPADILDPTIQKVFYTYKRN